MLRHDPDLKKSDLLTLYGLANPYLIAPTESNDTTDSVPNKKYQAWEIWQHSTTERSLRLSIYMFTNFRRLRWTFNEKKGTLPQLRKLAYILRNNTKTFSGKYHFMKLVQQESSCSVISIILTVIYHKHSPFIEFIFRPQTFTFYRIYFPEFVHIFSSPSTHNYLISAVNCQFRLHGYSEGIFWYTLFAYYHRAVVFSPYCSVSWYLFQTTYFEPVLLLHPSEISWDSCHEIVRNIMRSSVGSIWRPLRPLFFFFFFWSF